MKNKPRSARTANRPNGPPDPNKLGGALEARSSSDPGSVDRADRGAQRSGSMPRSAREVESAFDGAIDSPQSPRRALLMGLTARQLLAAVALFVIVATVLAGRLVA